MKQHIPSSLLVIFDDLPDDAFIRLSLLIAWGLIPFSASTLWRKCRSGQFPQPLRVSSQVTAWRVGDIREWLKNPSEFVAKSGNPKRANGQ
jgi:prophage regulatory protein